MENYTQLITVAQVINSQVLNELADFQNLSDVEFNQFVSEYKLLFDVIKSWNLYKIKDGINREEMFNIINNYWKEENEG